MKIILAGGTGYLGNLLVSHYLNTEHEIVIFSRSKRRSFDNIRFIRWDAQTFKGEWKQELVNADVLINLCGRTVNCKYNEENKREILNSRVLSTRILGKAIKEVEVNDEFNLHLWINFSSATIYKHSLDKDMTEEGGEIGEGFSVGICNSWEHEFYTSLYSEKIRKVALRLAMVMGKDDGPLVPLLGLSKLGLGGKQGNGSQYVSWLSEDDFTGIIDFIVSNEEILGSVNACSPNPEPNYLFMTHVRKAVNRKWGMNLSNWMLEVGAFFMQTETELVKKSRRVVPQLLIQKGYRFKYPRFENYVSQLVKK